MNGDAPSKRWTLRALAGCVGAPFVARAARPLAVSTALEAPEPMAQLHVLASNALLAVSRAGRMWLFEGRTWQRRGADLDPRTPIAAGYGRVAGRSETGGLWILEAGRATHSDAPRLLPFAGLVVLPLGVIAVAEGDRGRAHVVRLEPSSSGTWRETSRNADPVLPDARPQQVDLEGPIAAAAEGHIVVLGGPDAERYRHGVLGDDVEATRVMVLDRHGLAPLRTLALPAPHVLEDIAPRPIAWRGGTGLLTMRSGPRGAQLAVIAADPMRRDALVLAALGEPIGTPGRWMAATTDGTRLLAVHTPHIGGVLNEYAVEGAKLRGRPIATGFSTHALGSRELDLAVWTGGALVMPDQDRRALNVVAVASWSRRSVYGLDQPVIATRAWRFGDRPGVAALLEDGRVVWVAVATP